MVLFSGCLEEVFDADDSGVNRMVAKTALHFVQDVLHVKKGNICHGTVVKG